MTCGLTYSHLGNSSKLDCSRFGNGWRGYVVADLYSEKFTAPPYQVSIKAVDGFSLLKNIPFTNLDNTQIEGRKTVWELISSCIDLLELDVNIADWMDLYAEGMNQNISPLQQVYVDMEQFYATEGEPTYRDVLELCLRVFAGNRGICNLYE